MIRKQGSSTQNLKPDNTDHQHSIEHPMLKTKKKAEYLILFYLIKS